MSNGFPSWRRRGCPRTPTSGSTSSEVEREEDMTRRRSVWFIAVAVGALLGTLGIVGASAAPPATADATAVMQWNLIAVSTLTGFPGPGLPGPAGGAPPASAINMGMVQGAVYDAVNAITPKHHRPYLLKQRFANTASDEAAVATAAYLVLKNIVETVPQTIPFPNRATLLATLASQYEAAVNAIPDSPVQGSGDRCRHRGGAGDDRREEERWKVRAVPVRAEREPGVL